MQITTHYNFGCRTKDARRLIRTVTEKYARKNTSRTVWGKVSIWVTEGQLPPLSLIPMYSSQQTLGYKKLSYRNLSCYQSHLWLTIW